VHVSVSNAAGILCCLCLMATGELHGQFDSSFDATLGHLGISL